jgi:FkbM family methyltransferase
MTHSRCNKRQDSGRNKVTSTIRSWLRDKLIARLDVPDIPLALRRLAGRSFTPELIFDVGAFRGDFARSALAVWPNARIACFEPLPHGAQQIVDLKRRFPRIDLHAAVVGAEEKDGVEMRVANASSTMLPDAHNADYPLKTFPQTTVDAAVRNAYQGRAPDLLKLDVQGYELRVLEGAEKSLGGVRAILSELSLLDIHQGVPLLDEMLSWLSKRGFVAYDLCGMTRRPLDGALWQIDMIFLRRDDPLRQDKRYFNV